MGASDERKTDWPTRCHSCDDADVNWTSKSSSIARIGQGADPRTVHAGAGCRASLQASTKSEGRTITRVHVQESIPCKVVHVFNWNGKRICCALHQSCPKALSWQTKLHSPHCMRKRDASMNLESRLRPSDVGHAIRSSARVPSTSLFRALLRLLLFFFASVLFHHFHDFFARRQAFRFWWIHHVRPLVDVVSSGARPRVRQSLFLHGALGLCIAPSISIGCQTHVLDDGGQVLRRSCHHDGEEHRQGHVTAELERLADPTRQPSHQHVHVQPRLSCDLPPTNHVSCFHWTLLSKGFLPPVRVRETWTRTPPGEAENLNVVNSSMV